MDKSKNKKKIIFKIKEFPHLSETFIIAQILTAIKLGFEVNIVVSKLLDVKQSSHSDLLNKYNLLNKVIIEDYKIPVNKLIRLSKWTKLLIQNFQNFNYIFSFHKEQEKFSLTWLFQWNFYKQFNDASIIHVQYGTNKSPIDLLKKTEFFIPKVIVTFHGHDAFFPINGFIPNNGYYDNLFNYGDVITANTPYLKEKIFNLGCPEKKLKVLPVGVDTDFFYPNDNPKKNSRSNTLRLITVGRLDPVKGHVYSIEAVYELVKKGINITLTIIGDGAEKENIEKIIQNYKLENFVFMLGRKSQNEVRELLWEHDLYVLTAVALPDGRRETQGLATLEAQACGLPVIAFDSGGVRYTIDHEETGFMCEEYNVAHLIDKIELLYNNNDLLKKMSENTTNFINQNYAQNHIDSLWNEVYFELSK